MSDFFNELGRKITVVADEVGRKASETVDIQKLKAEIRSLNRANQKEFEEIGRIIYQQYQEGLVEDEAFLSICKRVENRKADIEKREEDIEVIKAM